MNIDAFLLRLVLLVIPGLAGYKTFRSLQSTGKSHKRLSDWQDFLSIILMSVLSYGFLLVILEVGNRISYLLGGPVVPVRVTNLAALTDQKIVPEPIEILYATFLSAVLGVFSALLYNRKVVYRVARKLRITKHYGDDDVWSYITNSDDVEWLIVRDHKVDLIYFGYMRVFSDSNEKRELLLGDVNVYRNSDGAKLYHIDTMYVSRDDDDLTLEIPGQNDYLGIRKGGSADAGRSKAASADTRRNREKGRSKGSSK